MYICVVELFVVNSGCHACVSINYTDVEKETYEYNLEIAIKRKKARKTSFLVFVRNLLPQSWIRVLPKSAQDS